jgi:hypothetical protein
VRGGQLTLYELREYQAVPGRLDVLVERFERVYIPVFGRLGFRVVGFWTEQGDSPERLFYLLAWESRQEMERGWTAFSEDEDALRVRVEGGPATTRMTSTFLQPTAFSVLQ